jgi:hypothetical protein
MVDNRVYVDTEFFNQNDSPNNILNSDSSHVEHSITKIHFLSWYKDSPAYRKDRILMLYGGILIQDMNFC